MKHSAGLLLYRRQNAGVEVLLVHPGGPFWAKKDAQAWSIPKGEFSPPETPLEAARREFKEETGLSPEGQVAELGTHSLGGKTIHIWAMEGNCDPDSIVSNSFTMEWPPKSGKMKTFPEVDRAAWFDLVTARRKLHKNQVKFIDDLEASL